MTALNTNISLTKILSKLSITMSKKSDIIEAKGTIYKESGNGYFNVELDEPAEHQCLCRASGKLITRKIQLLVGDRVTVELSPYDLTRGRITLREK